MSVSVEVQFRNLRTGYAKGYITANEFKSELDKMCDEYGTEFVAEIISRDSCAANQ